MTQPIHLCIGAPRAGTTWLYHNLRSQPSIFTPPVKEVRYWAGRRSRDQVAAEVRAARPSNDRQRAWLHRWQQATSKQRPDVGSYLELMAVPDVPSIDISPVYSLLPDHLVCELAEGLPAGSRVMYVVRDPLARTLSHIKLRFYLQGDGEPTGADLDAFFADERQLLRNDYATVVRRWSAAFGDRFAYLEYDDLQADPATFLRRVGDHLGVSVATDEATMRQRYWTDTARPAPGPGPELRRRAARAVLPYVEEFAEVRPDLAGRWLSGIEAALRA